MRPRSLVAPNATQKVRPENLVVAATAIAAASPFPMHRTKTPRECPGGRRGRPTEASGRRDQAGLARDLRLERDVAVKTLTGVSVSRLMALKPEAWAMATVTHPAVAEIHGIESWRGRPILVVEFLPGGTLADKLRRGPLPAPRALSVTTLLADALAALHEAGYLHGDVKPSNIGFTSNGSPKLLDFGLARETNDADTQGGTLRYLSPEVLSGLPAEEADDVWSLCVVLHEMVAGEHPFAGGGDSQLAFWTLEHLVEHGRLVPDELAQAFAARRIFGIGGSVQQFLDGVQAGRPWWQAAARSAGNGALMRIAPIVIAHLRTADPAFWSDAALCAAITHNDRGSIGTCTAFAGMLGELLARDRPPDPQWWVNRYVTVARDVEGNSCYRPRGGAFPDYRGPIWRFVEEHVPSALKDSLSVREAGRLWYSGAFLLETVPAVLFILARYGEDPEEATVRAVNDTKDNDTIAAIVGAAVGALHGEDALPRRWRDGLLGRTTADDDGRIFELLDRAEMRFGCEARNTSLVQAGDERVTRTRSKAAGGPGPAARVGPAMLARAQGCLLGQLAGDAPGGLVEFQTPKAIRRRYPKGVREMAGGGTWDTLAGQPTDDSELALTLARTLVEHGRYDPDALRKAYVSWLESEPFDCGATIVAGLTGRPNVGSQANGALMRISPLGIFGANLLAVDPACAVSTVGTRVGATDRETAAVGADPGGHPYRAPDSPVLPDAGASAQGSRGDGAGLRGQGGLRPADDAHAAGPVGHRCGVAAGLRLGAAGRGAERVGLLARLRRVRRHAVAPARARSADPGDAPRPAGGPPLPRLDGHRGP